jgi:hypothetical protein
MKRSFSFSVRSAALATVIAAALASAPAAMAGTCAPPGNSGVNQYVEVVPGAGCNQPPAGPGSGGHSGGGHLSTSTTQQLDASGGAGRSVVALVTSSPSAGPGNPGGSRGHAHGGGNPAAATTAVPPSVAGSNPVSAILHPIVTGSGAGGLGVLLPVLLLGVLLGAVLAGLIRRRRLSS